MTATWAGLAEQWQSYWWAGMWASALFANLTKVNAVRNAQNQNFLQKLLSSLGSGGKGGGGASGFNLGNFGLLNWSSALQAIKDGKGILAQFSGFTDETAGGAFRLERCRARGACSGMTLAWT